jgi:hypothetical protein
VRAPPGQSASIWLLITRLIGRTKENSTDFGAMNADVTVHARLARRPPAVSQVLRVAKTRLDVQQKLTRHADIRTTTQFGEVPMENQQAANSQAVRRF